MQWSFRIVNIQVHQWLYVNLCENSKIIQILRYFTGGSLDACFTQPVNIFEIKQKVCTLEQNLCKQDPSHGGLHMQQGKHTSNS